MGSPGVSLEKRLGRLWELESERAAARIRELFAAATPEQLARLGHAGERGDDAELARVAAELQLTEQLFDAALAGCTTPDETEARYRELFAPVWRFASASPVFHRELARLRNGEVD